MITTRYNLEVKITGYYPDMAVARCIREDDKAERNYNVEDLRATDGAPEILKACLAVPALNSKEIKS